MTADVEAVGAVEAAVLEVAAWVVTEEEEEVVVCQETVAMKEETQAGSNLDNDSVGSRIPNTSTDGRREGTSGPSVRTSCCKPGVVLLAVIREAPGDPVAMEAGKTAVTGIDLPSTPNSSMCLVSVGLVQCPTCTLSRHCTNP